MVVFVVNNTLNETPCGVFNSFQTAEDSVKMSYPHAKLIASNGNLWARYETEHFTVIIVEREITDQPINFFK